MKKYYLIDKNLGTGLFSELLNIIGHLIIAKKMNLQPIIHIKDKFKSILYPSLWLDYFNDINPPQTIDKIDSNLIYISKQNTIDVLPHSILAFNHPKIQEVHNIINEFVIVHQSIIDKVNNFKDRFNFKQKKILGVHARGTNCLQNIKRSYSYFKKSDLQLIKHIKNLYQFDQIFLATEDQNIHLLFLNFFDPGTVICKDCTRYSYSEKMNKNVENIVKQNKTIGVEFQIRENLKHNNPNIYYQMGEEVLIDSLLLSECDGLIGSISGVFNFAIYYSLKPQLYQSFEGLRRYKKLCKLTHKKS